MLRDSLLDRRQPARLVELRIPCVHTLGSVNLSGCNGINWDAG
jgi:hypothetical protein